LPKSTCRKHKPSYHFDVPALNVATIKIVNDINKIGLCYFAYDKAGKGRKMVENNLKLAGGRGGDDA
jgi:hypothetical protein